MYSRYGDLYKNGGFKIEYMGEKSLPIEVDYEPRFDKDYSFTLIYSWWNNNSMAQQGREWM